MDWKQDIKTACLRAPSSLGRGMAHEDHVRAMWGIVQIGISQLDFDFRDYAGRHF
jgi:hypothetical protein